MGIKHRPDVKSLNEEAVRFEIDMCIGCNRCMRACPVPLSAMVSIADLNLANISDEIAPHVAKFSDQCVMCGSCVPVCPVNNHRDLLMLALKQRLGIAWDGNVDMTSVLPSLPPGWDVPLLLSRLREQAMFRDPRQVPDNYLLHFVAGSKIAQLPPETVALREGEYGRNMLLILDGRFTASSAGANGRGCAGCGARQGRVYG